MAETFAGFETPDISKYFGVSPVQGHAIIQLATGADVNALPSTELEALQKIGPARFKPGATSYDQGFGDIPYGLQHLSEHPKGSHYAGDFNISFSSFNIVKFFERLFTIRPQSFTPANLARDLSGGTQSLLTLGIVDKITIGGQPVFATSTHDSSLIGSALTGANSFGQTKSGDPNKPETLFEKIARIGGGAVSALATGKALSGALTTEPTPVNAGTQGPPSPVSALGRVGNTFASSVGYAGNTYASGQFAQVVVGLLGQKIGGFLLSLISGDLAGAIKIITSNPSQPQPISSNPSDPLLYGPSGGGGGGGAGLGISNRNTGQTQSNTLVYVLIAGVVVIGGVYLLRRK